MVPNMIFKLLLIFYTLMSVVCSYEIPTCCPQGSTVKNVRDQLFECKPSSNEDLIKLKVLTGFQIRNSTRPNIPKCENIEIKPVSNRNVVLSSSSCVTVFEGEYVAFSCPVGRKDAGLKISAIKKCCPVGESYNFYKRTCEKSNDKFDVFNGFLNNPTIFEIGNLSCANEKVLVQYFSINHTFYLNTSDLIVGDQRFFSEYYCIESVIKSDVIDETGIDGYEILPPYQTYMVRACHPSNSICDKIPCIQRCCGDHQKMSSDFDCEPYPVDIEVAFHKLTFDQNHKLTEAETSKPKEYGVLHHMPECQSFMYLDDIPHYFDRDNGDFYLPTIYPFPLEKDDFCTDYAQEEDKVEVGIFICNKDIEPPFYIYISMVSCIFLFLTFCVYIFIPKLLNLHGKILVCYVFALLVSFIMLIVNSMHPMFGETCYAVAFIMYFSWLSSFSWLNAICIDIWSSLRTVNRGIRGTGEWKKFAMYSAYAWGISLFWTVLTYCVDHYRLTTKNFHPNIGQESCWFQQEGYGLAVFFLMPIGIIILINIVLFILTLRYCNKVKNEMKRMKNLDKENETLRDRFTVDKEKMSMNVKLFVIMGVSWIVEIFSSIFPGHDKIFYFSDVFHALQGVFIFLIFVCKRSVFEAIKQRIGYKTKPNSTPVPNSETSTTLLKSNSAYQ